jgi:hypothetical protein
MMITARRFRTCEIDDHLASSRYYFVWEYVQTSKIECDYIVIIDFRLLGAIDRDRNCDTTFFKSMEFEIAHLSGTLQQSR